MKADIEAHPDHFNAEVTKDSITIHGVKDHKTGEWHGQESAVTKETPAAEEAPTAKRTIGGDLEDKLNEDGTITLYHRTGADSAKNLLSTQAFKSKFGTGESYFSTRPDEEIKGYGDTSIAFEVDPKHVNSDDAFESGEEHVTIDAGHLKKVRNLRLHGAEEGPGPTPEPPAKEQRTSLLDHVTTTRGKKLTDVDTTAAQQGLMRGDKVIDPDMSTKKYYPALWNEEGGEWEPDGGSSEVVAHKVGDKTHLITKVEGDDGEEEWYEYDSDVWDPQQPHPKTGDRVPYEESLKDFKAHLDKQAVSAPEPALEPAAKPAAKPEPAAKSEAKPEPATKRGFTAEPIQDPNGDWRVQLEVGDKRFTSPDTYESEEAADKAGNRHIVS